MGRLSQTIYGVPPTESQGERCKVGHYLDALSPEDADDLRDALTTKIGDKYAAPAARIAMAMHQEGYPLSSTLISEHRSRLCRCYRKVADSE